MNLLDEISDDLMIPYGTLGDNQGSTVGLTLLKFRHLFIILFLGFYSPIE